MKTCPRCNFEIQEDQTKCPNCDVVFAQWAAAHAPSSTDTRIPSKTFPPERSFIFVVIVTLAWGMIDAFIFDQGCISVILCIAGILYFLPRAIEARQDRARFKLRLSKAVITFVVGFATIEMISNDRKIARGRAGKLVAAVEQSYAKYGHYPDKLEEVVPEFISEIPRAKSGWGGRWQV